MLADFNMLKILPEVMVPTLVVSGKHDPITPPEPGGERIASLIPAATGIVYESSAHFPFIEQEEEVLADISDWIASLSA